jgi:hypothetical protein
MANKKTAVDFAIEQLEKLIPNGNQMAIFAIIKQAKQMQKEQKIEFANKVLQNAECSFTGMAYLEKDIDDIYNETYNVKDN